MCSGAHKLTRYQDYLVIDAGSDGKHEFFDGQVLAMSGVSPTRAQLATNLAIRLEGAVLGGPCRGYRAVQPGPRRQLGAGRARPWRGPAAALFER